MKIEGEHEFDVERPALWAALMDPEVMASTLPGFQRLERVGPNEFEGELAIGIGPVQGRFDGRVELSELNEPESYDMRFSGRGPAGHVTGSGRIALSELPTGSTMTYAIDLQVGGRVAAVGQRVLDMTARMMSKQALEALARAVRKRSAAD